MKPDRPEVPTTRAVKVTRLAARQLEKKKEN